MDKQTKQIIGITDMWKKRQMDERKNKILVDKWSSRQIEKQTDRHTKKHMHDKISVNLGFMKAMMM